LKLPFGSTLIETAMHFKEAMATYKLYWKMTHGSLLE